MTFGEYEKTTDQREARKHEKIWVRFDIGDFLLRAGAPILVSMGRGIGSWPPRPEVSEVESSHASRRDGSTNALPFIIFYLAAMPITHGGRLCICWHRFPMGSRSTRTTRRTMD